VFCTALQVFKIVKKISPLYLHGTFSFAVDVTGCSGSFIDYLFLELELIMLNGHWHTEGQPFGTDYRLHFKL